MSREAWERIVQSYQSWDPRGPYQDKVCLYTVSKQIRGESRVERSDVQECPDCKTLKRMGQFEMEIGSGPCDSPKSQELLNGEARGELVAAYEDGATSNRGGMSGRFQWQGAGASVVGRTFAILNAGTHYDPVSGCEKCAFPGHAEGWLRGAITEGECVGCRVNGAMAYKFEVQQEGAVFYATLEGLLICQCD